MSERYSDMHLLTCEERRTVGSAMAPPRRPAPLAAHLLLHSKRMPHVVPSQHLRFGVSYSRAVLDEHGPVPRGPHLKADLSRFGQVEDGVLTCTMHGWRFELATGRCLTSDGARIYTEPAPPEPS